MEKGRDGPTEGDTRPRHRRASWRGAFDAVLDLVRMGSHSRTPPNAALQIGLGQGPSASCRSFETVAASPCSDAVAARSQFLEWVANVDHFVRT